MKQLTNIGALMIVMALFAATASASDPLGLNLPTGPVSMDVSFPGAYSYWGVTFSGIPAGYDVENQYYNGWCADANSYLTPGAHQTILYSAYDDSLPAQADSENWDKITYMVNRYRFGNYACASKYDIQALVWEYLGDSYTWGTLNPDCMATIRADVNANGEGFVPSTNQIKPILAYTVEDNSVKQLIFVEVPFMAPELASALAAIALVSPAFGYLLVKKRN